jgi:L-seryl-tRNA(Ser) seleniumtransferase
MASEGFRGIPQLDRILREPGAIELLSSHPRAVVVAALRDAVDELRSLLRDQARGAGGSPLAAAGTEAILERARALVEERGRSAYRRVVNGTGIILHTGLGRAVLPAAALRALAENLGGYSLVELDVRTGERSERERGIRKLLRELTGAASAIAVNNNAAATILVLAALARGRDVIISRGELVEIGGSFRMPDILVESGARLVEVGTTNRTHLHDYERAVTPGTGLILQVHASNYEIRGFTAKPALDDLVALGRRHGVPVVSDLGSGCFVDVRRFGLRAEPLVRDVVRAGVDLVCFSGDKLLGGPQAGIIVGGAEAVRRLRGHPLYRSLRIDKTTLSLLDATLRLYLDPARIEEEIPAIRALAEPIDEVERRARSFSERVRSSVAPDVAFDVVRSAAAMGSGSLPAQEVPSWALTLERRAGSAEDLARELRLGDPPVFSRVRDGRILIDFRTVRSEDEDALARALTAL